MIRTLSRGARCAVALACAAVGGQVFAATVVVTPATLVSAFAAANAGDTLKLVGTFGSAWVGNRSFSRVVTLDASRALFTETLGIGNVTNLKVSGGTYRVGNDAAHTKAIAVSGGSNIWIDRVNATGTGTGMTVGTDYGIYVDNTTNVQVSNGRFTGFRAAIVLGSVSTGSVNHNRISGATADGIDIADGHHVTASYNTCSGGNPGPGAHPDCIQLWSVAGHPLQSDNIVSYNYASGPTQGFTSFSDHGGALRIQIVHNIANTSYSQGVACYECVDSTISYNTVSTLPGATDQTYIHVIRGTDNTVVGNVINPVPPVAIHRAAAFAALAFDADGGVASVPEPATWALMLTGFAAVGIARRRTPLRA